jgi:hypothetical protein
MNKVIERIACHQVCEKNSLLLTHVDAIEHKMKTDCLMIAVGAK